VFSLENEDSDDMTLIDKKNNVFVMSNKKSKYPILQVDLRLISDLVVIIVFAAIGGIVFSCLGQPVIVGYLLAGSIIGPGGLKFISEMVQVETVAQFGVVFLLFALGLEFSMTKVGISLHLTNLNTISCRLCNITLTICCSCVNATAESRWPSCCPWRASSNCLTHVFVWCNCLGMAKDFSMCAYTAILKLFLELISDDMCSCVEQGCQRVFLLVPFYLCHQLQWW
jgi:hypothetical protein